MTKRRRRLDPIGLSFLDAMTCGFGAVVLFFMIIQGAAEEKVQVTTIDRRAEVDKLEREVLEGWERLVELRNSDRESQDERKRAEGLSRRLLETLEEVRAELATFDAATLASREHLNQLQTDLLTLEKESRRLSASVPDDDTPGDRVRAFVGDGDRQYLTGLKLGGQRTLVLVDASASMLAETVVNVLVRRNLEPAQRRRAAKWRRAVDTVDWLLTQLPQGSYVQVYRFSESTEPVLSGDADDWLEASDRKALERVMAGLRGVAPEGGTNLETALGAVARLDPPPDNLVLLTDGLPTQDTKRRRRSTISGRDRLKLFNRAVQKLPSGLPVNVVLMPMEGDPDAPAAYWRLALATRGSFLSPPEDWP
ncbi:MAG: VWA domain-containing protein [Acidobacteriota bacterium]